MHRRCRTDVVGFCEPLECRRLLHGLPDGSQIELALKINFQPPGAEIPAGYLADTGAVFGDRGNGLSYGWDQDNRRYARDRDHSRSPDQRYDTFTHTQLYGVRTWELAVPDGDYAVRIVAGEPDARNSVYAFNVESVRVVAGTPTHNVRWFDGTRTVTVSDGRLTLSNAPGSYNNKVAFIEVTSVHPAPPPATTVSVIATDASAAEAGLDLGTFFLSRSGPTTQPMPVSYSLGGTATNGLDYYPLWGSATIPAGSTGVVVTVSPLIDRQVEGNETVSLTLSAGADYAVGSSATAVVTIADADSPLPEPAPADWKTLAPSPVARFESGSAAIDGKLYVFGGYDKRIVAMARSDVYDPTTDRWSRIADMPQPITHAGVTTDGPFVYFAGGFVGERSFETTANVWRYDTRSNSWSAMTPLPAARAAGGLVRVGRTLHFFGGTSTRQVQDYGEHWVLDLDAARGTPGAAWRAAAPLPLPRNHFGYAAVGARIYCIGGLLLGDEKLGNVADVHVYDSTTDRWSVAAPLPLPLSHVHTATVVIDGRIVTVGGTSDNAYFPRTVGDVLAYDPATNAWTALPPLPDVRQAAVAQLIGERLYVTTGTPTGIHPQPTTWSRRITFV